MSMQTECYYGYGFNIEGCEDESLKQFLINHKGIVQKLKFGKEITETLDKDVSISETFEDYQSDYSFMESAFGIIADVMTEETDIRFEYHRDDEGTEVIMLTQSLPWVLNRAELALTQEKIDKILNGYIKELNLSCKPDDQRIEYYG